MKKVSRYALKALPYEKLHRFNEVIGPDAEAKLYALGEKPEYLIVIRCNSSVRYEEMLKLTKEVQKIFGGGSKFKTLLCAHGWSVEIYRTDEITIDQEDMGNLYSQGFEDRKQAKLANPELSSNLHYQAGYTNYAATPKNIEKPKLTAADVSNKITKRDTELDYYDEDDDDYDDGD